MNLKEFLKGAASGSTAYYTGAKNGLVASVLTLVVDAAPIPKPFKYLIDGVIWIGAVGTALSEAMIKCPMAEGIVDAVVPDPKPKEEAFTDEEFKALHNLAEDAINRSMMAKAEDTYSSVFDENDPLYKYVEEAGNEHN